MRLKLSSLMDHCMIGSYRYFRVSLVVVLVIKILNMQRDDFVSVFYLVKGSDCEIISYFASAFQQRSRLDKCGSCCIKPMANHMRFFGLTAGPARTHFH